MQRQFRAPPLCAAGDLRYIERTRFVHEPKDPPPSTGQSWNSLTEYLGIA